MRAFDELTPIGRSRRLAALARSVLATEFGLHTSSVRLVAAHSFNIVFRVTAPQLRAAIRIGTESRIHPVGVEDIEAAWLDDLTARGLTVPQNLATSSGERWTTARHCGVPGERVCTLFTWVDGVVLKDRLTLDAIRNAGGLLARLHQCGAAAAISNVAPDLLADRAVYFADRDRISTHPHRDQVLFADAVARVQTVLDELWQDDQQPHLLHGDFGPHNILSWRRNLRPIDFQDLRVGYRVQDLGVTIADLSRRDPSLVAPFTQGYAAVEPLPEMSPRLLEALAAARSLNIMNLALFAPSSGIGAAFDEHAELVRQWMLTTS